MSLEKCKSEEALNWVFSMNRKNTQKMLKFTFSEKLKSEGDANFEKTEKFPEEKCEEMR